MRAASFLCCLALAACTSGGTPAERRGEVTDVVSGSGGDMRMGNSELRDVHQVTIAAPLDVVWAVLPAVYDSLGIPVTLRDPASRVVGNNGLEVRRLLAGTMVSRFFDCGEGRGGSSALSYDLFLDIQTRVQSRSATETQLSTTVNVRARPISNSGDWIRCETRGLLEQRIADAAMARSRR